MSIFLVLLHTLVLLANSNAQNDVDESIVERNVPASLPIDFRNLPLEGAGDPKSKQKQPFDPDPFLLMQDLDRIRKNIKNKTVLISRPADLYDIPSIRKGRPLELKRDTNATSRNDPGTFYIEDGVVLENWTTCDEFAKGAYFHPQDVTGIEWIPFYQWSVHRIPDIGTRRYSVPTKKAVAWYKQQYNQYLGNVDWSQPKLMMTFGDLEMLLIAMDRKGKFRVIPKYDLPEYLPYGIKFPQLVIHMKLVKERYLVLMDCDSPFAVAMAAKNDLPRTHRARFKALQAINFRGNAEPVETLPKRRDSEEN